MRRKAICVLVVLIQARQGGAKREKGRDLFYLAALTFVNVPGVSRIAVKVKSKSKIKVVVLALSVT